MRFVPINIGIHGIRPAMVKNEPEFNVIWDKIKDYFNGSLVVAHNAAFDISVLRRTLELYNIEYPEFNYICTMKLARNFYRGIDNAKLNTLSEYLDFTFKHHDALNDALACSNILLKISEELETDDIEEISKITGVTIGQVTKEGYTPSQTKGRILRTSNRIYVPKIKNLSDIFSYDAFKGEIVVFTRKLQTLERSEAMRLVRRAGGECRTSVSKKTTILVSNMKDIEGLERDEMSIKFRRAFDLNNRGENIKILNEEEFLNYSRD